MTAQGSPFPARLALLRAELARQDLAGFVVPRTDEHQGEYVPPRAQRLAWISGFTGSAGLAVVLADKAAVFVDGRYTMQVRAQVDGTLYDYCHLSDEPPEAWIEAKLPRDGRLGMDPWLHSRDQVQRLAAAPSAPACRAPSGPGWRRPAGRWGVRRPALAAWRPAAFVQCNMSAGR